jgi:hypothetical protein
MGEFEAGLRRYYSSVEAELRRRLERTLHRANQVGGVIGVA